MKKQIIKVLIFSIAMAFGIITLSNGTIATDDPEVENWGYSTLVDGMNMCVDGGYTCDGTAVVVIGTQD